MGNANQNPLSTIWNAATLNQASYTHINNTHKRHNSQFWSPNTPSNSQTKLTPCSFRHLLLSPFGGTIGQKPPNPLQQCSIITFQFYLLMDKECWLFLQYGILLSSTPRKPNNETKSKWKFETISNTMGHVPLMSWRMQRTVSMWVMNAGLLWCEWRMWGLLQCEWHEELSWTYNKASLGLTSKIYKITIFDRAT